MDRHFAVLGAIMILLALTNNSFIQAVFSYELKPKCVNGNAQIAIAKVYNVSNSFNASLSG